MSFQTLLHQYGWREIPGCPGRYLLRGGISRLSPAELLGEGADLREANFDAAPDPVSYCRFSGGGLISFRKQGGYIHTLCNQEGFERKMNKLKGESL